MWRFVGLLHGSRAVVAWGAATLVVSSALALAPPAATKIIVDHVLSAQPLPEWLLFWMPSGLDRHSHLYTLCLAALGLNLLQILVRLLGRWQIAMASRRLQLDLRRRLIRVALLLPLHRVHELKSGGMASLLRDDASSIGDLVFWLLYNPFRALVQLAGALCILAWIDWRLLLGVAIVAPLVLAAHNSRMTRLRRLHRDLRDRRQAIDASATEIFSGLRVVRAFGRERRVASRFLRLNHALGRQEMRAWWWTRAADVAGEAVVPLVSAVLLLYGGQQVLSGAMSCGDLMMAFMYLFMLLAPLVTLTESITSGQNGLSALDRVLDLLAEAREAATTGKPLLRRSGRECGRITFDRVSFGYPDVRELAVNDVSLDVAPGQLIAFVGPSGSGKTTLCNLIARFFDPASGRLLLDGTDIRHFEVGNYRQLLGIVEQDIFLFDGTVRENIAFANRRASDADVLRAAEAAQALGFIRTLPQGMATHVGERGVKLSRGQRQRLAIARAILADPRILILDEATSSLDTESEEAVQVSLTNLMRGRTSFVIAHRLSTIRHADQIVVIENGRISETGTHDQLVTLGGRYAAMADRQSQSGHRTSVAARLRVSM